MWIPLLLAGIASLSGCAHAPGGRLTDWWHNGLKVGPNYSPPPAPVADEWIDYHDPRVHSQEEQLQQWWSVFGDPTLDSLIHLAYQQNLTLRTAGARILEARAQRGIAVGNLFPQTQQGFGEYQRIKVSQETAFPVNAAWFSNRALGFNASWELDFWGRYRRAVEAADAELDATVENYDDVLVVLLADVAANYIQYRTFEERLYFAHENVESQAATYKLIMDRFKEGKDAEIATHQSRQRLEQTRSRIPALEIGKRQASNRLCVLLGMPPTDLENLLGQNGKIPNTPTDAFVGVPADLLRQRPDVRRAERQVAAQSARIGVAVSDLYPHITLLGTIGVQSEHLSDLFDLPRSMIGSVGPGVRWDILNYGRLLNNIHVQDARFQELAYAYQDRVLNAGREVEDALVAFLQAQQQAEYLAGSVDAAQQTVGITTTLEYREKFGFLPDYVFQGALAQQQDLLAATRGEIALSLVQVYRSLGGGWQIRLAYDGSCGSEFAADARDFHIEEVPLPDPQPEPAGNIPD